MKKLSALLLAAVFVFTPLFSFDFGGVLNPSFSFTHNESALNPGSSFSNADTLSLWSRQTFSGGWYLVGEGNYRFSLQKSLDNFNLPAAMSDTLDLTLLKGVWTISGAKANHKIEAGRFSYSDVSGMIINQTMDGIYYTNTSSLVEFSAYAGYTGLLNAKTCNVQGIDFTIENPAQLYSLAPKYLAFSGRGTLPNLMFGHSFGAELIMIKNLNDQQKVTGSKDAVYYSMTANGPITNGIYYSAQAALNATFTDLADVGETDATRGFLGRASVSWYPGYKSSAVVGNIAFSTSDFSPFTGISASLDGSMFHTGLFTMGFSASIKPVSAMVVSASADFLVPEVGGNYELGALQYQASAKYQLLSDVMISASWGHLIPLNSNYKTFMTGAVGLQLSF